MALPMVTPTIKPPIRPGPAVAATASIASKPSPASASAWPMAGIEQLDMGARGDFRHHAAIGRMQIELRAHHARQDLAAAVRRAAHHRGGGLVAARLDAEHGQGSGLCRSLAMGLSIGSAGSIEGGAETGH